MTRKDPIGTVTKRQAEKFNEALTRLVQSVGFMGEFSNTN